MILVKTSIRIQFSVLTLTIAMSHIPVCAQNELLLLPERERAFGLKDAE